jgi:hypothetical protein
MKTPTRKSAPAKAEARTLTLIEKNGRHFLSQKLTRKDILERIRADRDGK